MKCCFKYKHVSVLPFPRHRVSDCRHFILITGLLALVTILPPITKTHKQTSYFEMYAYNCNPRRTILGIYPLFLLCNPTLEISTWHEVIDFLLDTCFFKAIFHYASFMLVDCYRLSQLLLKILVSILPIK